MTAEDSMSSFNTAYLFIAQVGLFAEPFTLACNSPILERFVLQYLPKSDVFHTETCFH